MGFRMHELQPKGGSPVSHLLPRSFLSQNLIDSLRKTSSCKTVEWLLAFGSAIFECILSLGPTACASRSYFSNACGTLGVSASPSKA